MEHLTDDISSIPPGDILTDTSVVPVAGIEGRYIGHIPEAWRVMFAFGGTTMATAIRAAVTELGRDDLQLVGAEATYCQAIPCGPVAVQVEVLRQGRAGAQALVRLWSLTPTDADGTGEVRTDLVVAVVLGRRKDLGMGFVGAVAPEVPEPGDCVSREEAAGDSPYLVIPYHQQTQFRITDSRAMWGPHVPAGDPVASSWFRFNVSPRGDSGLWEPAVLAVPGDILGLAVHSGVGGGHGFFFVVSLQIGLKFIEDVETEWVLQHSTAHSVHGGFASGTAELYDANRRLVAIATQTALLRPFATDPGASDA